MAALKVDDLRIRCPSIGECKNSLNLVERTRAPAYPLDRLLRDSPSQSHGLSYQRGPIQLYTTFDLFNDG